MLRSASVQPAIYKLNPALSSSFRTRRSITARRRGEDAAGSRCICHVSAPRGPRGCIRPAGRSRWGAGRYHPTPRLRGSRQGSFHRLPPSDSIPPTPHRGIPRVYTASMGPGRGWGWGVGVRDVHAYNRQGPSCRCRVHTGHVWTFRAWLPVVTRSQSA